jgi:hypothetical protein
LGSSSTRMRCSWPISPSEAPKRSDGRLHTRPFHAHATCGSAPPPTTIRTCLDRGALQPVIVIPSRVLLAAARRYRPKAQKLHRSRANTGMFERAPCTATLAPFRGEADPHHPPFRRSGIGRGILAVGSAGVPPVPLPPPKQVRCCHPCHRWWVAVMPPLRRRPPSPSRPTLDAPRGGPSQDCVLYARCAMPATCHSQETKRSTCPRPLTRVCNPSAPASTA